MTTIVYKNKIFVIIFFIFLLNLQEVSSQTLKLKSCSQNDTCLLPSQCNLTANMKDAFTNGPLMGTAKMVSSICSVGIFNIRICCSTPNLTGDRRINDYIDKPLFPPKCKNEKVSSSSFTPLHPPKCGFSNSTHNKVVGGTPAEPGAWPWIVALGQKFRKLFVISCGASLITSRHLLTAAHCVKKSLFFTARLGVNNIENVNGEHPVDLGIKKYIAHPHHNDVTKENDIAILELERDVEFTALIQPICLPFDESIGNRSFVGYYPFVAGWGTTYHGGFTSPDLRETQIPIISNEVCRSMYANKSVIIDDRVECAGYAQGGKDACQGDSGGPLMLPRDGYYYLIGIVSNGYGCAKPKYPGIYTRVSKFLDFIKTNID